MKHIFSILIFILISCQGQKADTLKEIKSERFNTIEVQRQKNNTDSVAVIFTLSRKYLLKSNEKLKLSNIEYSKDFNNNSNKNGHIDREDNINLNDTVHINIKYLKIIKLNDFKNLTKKKYLENNITYKILNTVKLYDLLKEFRNDDLLFKYRYENNPKELQVLSISIYLK